METFLFKFASIWFALLHVNTTVQKVGIISKHKIIHSWKLLYWLSEQLKWTSLG